MKKQGELKALTLFLLLRSVSALLSNAARSAVDLCDHRYPIAISSASGESCLPAEAACFGTDIWFTSEEKYRPESSSQYARQSVALVEKRQPTRFQKQATSLNDAVVALGKPRSVPVKTTADE